MASEDTREKWYYDSNTLDLALAYREITSKKHPKRVFISYLAIGEAYGNSLRKGEEIAEAFIEIVNRLDGFIEIVENDGSKNIFDDVRETFPRLSVTDALHLATAIENGCCILRSNDRDLCGLDKSSGKTKLKELVNRHGVSHLAITHCS